MLTLEIQANVVEGALGQSPNQTKEHGGVPSEHCNITSSVCYNTGTLPCDL